MPEKTELQRPRPGWDDGITELGDSPELLEAFAILIGEFPPNMQANG